MGAAFGHLFCSHRKFSFVLFTSVGLLYVLFIPRSGPSVRIIYAPTHLASHFMLVVLPSSSLFRCIFVVQAGHLAA